MRALRALALLLALLALGSCTPESEGSGTPCVDEGDCASFDGSPQACLEGRCATVECLSSLTCPFGSYCDTESGEFDCDPGCREDSDCPSGDRCDDGYCVARGCRSAVLDCEFGELCDDGACVRPEEPYCAPCDPAFHEWNYGVPSNACDDRPLGHDLCGGYGNFCLNNGSYDYCAIQCFEEGDCPNGYVCAVVTYTLPASCPGADPQIGMACLSACR